MSQDGQDNQAELIRIERDGRGELAAYLRGRKEPEKNVKIARCFPWSVQEGYISIRNKDGKEIVLLKGLDGLEPETREIIERELRDKVFVPKIQRVTKHTAEFDVIYITAETDRGEVTFQIRSRDDVRQLSATRAIFRDVDGNAYEVADVTALDHISRKHLDQYF